jgi:hypothetical protein
MELKGARREGPGGVYRPRRGYDEKTNITWSRGWASFLRAHDEIYYLFTEPPEFEVFDPGGVGVTTLRGESPVSLGSLSNPASHRASQPQATLKEHMKAVFNGDGYSAEWLPEAEKRGLFVIPTQPDAIRRFTVQKNVDLFQKNGVFSPEEVCAGVTNQQKGSPPSWGASSQLGGDALRQAGDDVSGVASPISLLPV